MTRYHTGEIAVQESVGVRHMAERLSGSAFTVLPEPAQRFLQECSFAAITWSDDAGKLWITPLTGAPGFLRAVDENTVLCDLSNCFAPLVREQKFENSPCALVVMDFAGRRRMRVNGHVNSKEHLLISVEEAYANCPKYIHRRWPQAASTGLPDDDCRTPFVEHVTTRTRLDENLCNLINNSDTFFIGTFAPASGADASHRGGAPGFVKADSDTIRWLDYPGNNMFNTFGNIQVNRETALLFTDFQLREALAVSGVVERFSPSVNGRPATDETILHVQCAKYLPRALAQSWISAEHSQSGNCLTI